MRRGLNKGLFSWSFSKGGSMKEQFDFKVDLLRPF
jgi:hypothetical protein